MTGDTDSKCEGIRGMLLPLPTVFDGTGGVDVTAMRALARFYVKKGVNALFLLGTFGQGPSLDPDARRLVVTEVANEIGDAVPLVVHVGAVDPYTCMDLGTHARETGAASIAMVGPYYYKHSPEEVREFISKVDAEVGLPIILYNNPGTQGYTLTLDNVRAMISAVPNIFATKIAGGSVEDVVAYTSALPDVGVFALSSALFPGMLMGMRGTISPPLLVAPELGVELIHAIEEDRYGHALALQLEVLRLNSIVQRLTQTMGFGARAALLRATGVPVVEFPRWPVRATPSELEGKAQDIRRDVLEKVDSILANDNAHAMSAERAGSHDWSGAEMNSVVS